MKTQSFEINIEQAVLDDLRARLARTRWTDEVAGVHWDYGADLSYFKGLLSYWQEEFDWRALERDLNTLAHRRTDVDGFGLHFVHERSAGANAVPLLLLHGFPDSFLRYLKLIPLLTRADPAGVSFDVVVPSLPGYGFSDRPRVRGMTSRRMAELLGLLMTEQLGYRRFAVHGGDWGNVIAEDMAQLFPDNVVALHLAGVPWRHFMQKPDDLSEREQQMFAANAKWQQSEGAYAMIQSTQPQTLALALNDSPVGLAAWIVEKFRRWSDCGGDVERRFSKDELLTNVTLYWVTQTINSAMRIYYEEGRALQAGSTSTRVATPTAFANFPKDISCPPREWAERFFNVVRWTELPRGGHFTAMEEPELLARDLRQFLGGQTAAANFAVERQNGVSRSAY